MRIPPNTRLTHAHRNGRALRHSRARERAEARSQRADKRELGRRTQMSGHTDLVIGLREWWQAGRRWGVEVVARIAAGQAIERGAARATPPPSEPAGSLPGPAASREGG